MNIACPNCHEDLRREPMHDLMCPACGSRFPKRGSVDVLLSEEEWKNTIDYNLRHAEAQKQYLTGRRFPLAIQYYDWWAQKMWEKLPQNMETALELMCGGLELSQRAPNHVRQMIAIDINPSILENVKIQSSKELLDRTYLICGTATRIPLKSQSVHAVLIMGGLHHVRPWLKSVLGEVSRILKPGGRLVASEPANDHWLIRTIRHYQYRFSPLQGKDEDEDGFTKSEIQNKLAESGLVLESYETFGFVAYPLLGNMDLLPILKKSQSRRLGRWLIQMDEALGKIPLIRRMAWANLFTALKPK